MFEEEPYISRLLRSAGLLGIIAVNATFCNMLLAQSASPARLDHATAYIVFLHWHAREAAERSSALNGGAHARARANRLHVTTAELEVLDTNAKSYVTRERSLREEALRYHQACKDAGKA